MHPIKKSFINIIILYVILGYLTPLIYYPIGGWTLNYSQDLGSSYQINAIIINVTSAFLAIFLICITPVRNYYIEVNDCKNISLLPLIIVSVVTITAAFYLSTKTYIYLNYLISPGVILLYALYLNGKRINNIYLLLTLIILFYIFQGSRAAILIIILAYLSGNIFTQFKLYKNKLVKFITVGILISPIIFYIATGVRYLDFDYSTNSLFRMIVNRLSMSELAAIPLECLDLLSCNLGLFYDKYPLLNQFKNIINSIVIGDIFEKDIMPNNYYEAIFLHQDVNYVIDNYMSYNMSLTTYMYMYFEYWSILVAAIIVYIYFLITISFRNYATITLIMLVIFYQLLIFFDWVMIFKSILSLIFTILTIKFYSKIICINYKII